MSVLGMLLGNYRVLEKLGEGGMGEVFLGRHESLGHPVAVKILRSELSSNAEMVKRFFNEAQAATSIRSPGIVQIFDFGTAPDGSGYFVMELLEGQSLAARLKQRRLYYAECCRIGRQIANVLHTAHARGITHRDLKPDNLFLVPDPEVPGGERVKVLDFGIAKLAGEVQAAGVKTRTGLAMGTPTYMSPEQCRGAGLVDSRADIYSLGCVLFEMACGRPPFLGEGIGEIVGAHLHVPPPAPQSLAPDLPPALAALVTAMLAKQPEGRPQTMAAVGQALDEILRGLEGPARQPSLPPERAGASLPIPVPQVTNYSTTLGGAAGASGSGTRPQRGGRSPLLFVGIVLACAVAGIVLVVALSGGGKQKQQQGSNDVVAGGGSQAVNAETATADAPPATGDAPSASPAGKPSDLELECLGLQTSEKWADLDACADRLAASNAPRAKDFKDRALQEVKSRPRIEAAEAALLEKNLKKAKAELDQVWPGSTSYRLLKGSYDAAEAAAITDLVKRLTRAVASDCKAYNALLAQERAAKPPRVAEEAAKQVSCPAAAAAPPPPPPPPPPSACDLDALLAKGRDSYGNGQYAQALVAFEAAYACKPDQATLQKALISACNLRNVPKAKQLWKKLSAQARQGVGAVCLRNGINEDELNAR